jgi:hypothetical protein
MHDYHPILKDEIDARDQYARDKEMLFAWRSRVYSEKEALDVKLCLESDFAAFLDYSNGPDAA